MMQIRIMVIFSFLRYAGLIAFISMGLYHSAFAASEAQVTPASFGENEAEFIREFDIADYDLSEELIVRCGARVREDGRVRALLCEGEPERGRATRRAIRRIANFVRNMKLQPAMINGVATQVWYNFSVIATPGAVEPQIISNHLHNQEALGTNYIAPQRYDYPRWRSCVGMPETGISAEASINSQGEVTDINIVGGTQGYGSCIASVRNNIMNSKFIPGFSNGEAVDALFVELFK